MRKNYRKSRPEPIKKHYRINEAIRAESVRLIDEEGEHKGTMPFAEALKIARDLELDLVEIEPTADPPVCKIVDVGKLRYQQEKELKKQRAKQKKVEVKGIRISLRISDHDRAVRVSQAAKFLEQNDKVKLEMVLRGRERQRGGMARDIIKDFISELEAKGFSLGTETPVSMQGGRLSTIIGLKN
ncbi:translation initiation factor IF-3 [Candidatus Uhrbacteria bacterium]|nr:translation initiation factor IF-3 [Candidatus Uhrbacteria bacterium]